MNNVIAYDDDGSIMSSCIINTISPIEYEKEAKLLSLFFLQTVMESGDNDVNLMLSTNLYDKYTGELTHVMCSRTDYFPCIRKQHATMLAENLNGEKWVSDTYFYLTDSPDVDIIKQLMCFVIGDKDKFLDYIGLVEK